MDPVSLCASIITIIKTAETGLKGLRKLKQCWKAPEEIDELNQEIRCLQATLRDVATFIEAADSTLYCANLVQPVARASEIILSLVERTSTARIHAVIPRLSDVNSARIAWSWYRTDVKRLSENLRVVRMDLSLQLSLVAAYDLPFVLHSDRSWVIVRRIVQVI